MKMSTDTFADYQAIQAMNASVIKAGLVSMRHMRYAALYPSQEPTPAMWWGKIVHSAVLEPDTFRDRYAVWSGASRRGKKYDAFLASANDRETITLAEYNDALYMAKAVRENVHARKLLGELVAREESLTFDLDGRPCKGRLDGRGADYILDLKTVSDVTERACERQFYNLGYHIQMGWYRFGANKVYHIDHKAYIIAIESDPPYDCVVYNCSRSFLERGMIEADRIAKEYDECCRKQYWPGVRSDVATLDLPAWATPDVDLI